MLLARLPDGAHVRSSLPELFEPGHQRVLGHRPVAQEPLKRVEQPHLGDRCWRRR